jgi:activator of HSP90 ATPase
MAITITQKVVFKNTNAGELYSMYLDPVHHSAITNGKAAKISANEGSEYSANGGGHSGKILQLIENRLIVQSFFAKDWHKGDIYSTLILLFEQNGRDAIIKLTHVNIPDRESEKIKSGWRKFYWTPWKKYLRRLNKK